MSNDNSDDVTQPGARGDATTVPSANAGALTRLRYFGDYELIDEIARGGMGVVWRARQVSLNRTVAVKMILSGQFASEAEVKRFRVEAEAAANLQHPNIVAIHEVGEHEGRHYFSMDYIEGKNLAEYVASLPEPQSAQQIARVMKAIAEAVHYAHQRGTLHRDLKPQNVLIDSQGQPHITDFGLAKRIETSAPGAPTPSADTSELTQTGAVIGSPSYMAPEQAAARADAIGPATDVYSLGAILYQLLTGKPPHRGTTTHETIQCVLSEEPVAPRKVRPEVPEDLETICLKCIEKSPERRYATARQLAEELGRFFNGEPILARPPNPLRKIWSWSARNPWAIALAAGFALVLSFGAIFGLREQMLFERRQGILNKAKQFALAMPLETSAKRGALYVEGMEALREAVKIRSDSDVRPLAQDLLSRSDQAFRRVVHSHGTQPNAMQIATVSANGRFLAAAFKDGVAEVFSVDTGESVFKTPALKPAKPLVALSADGAWFALADQERVPGEVRLWSWADTAEPLVLPAHAGAVTALAFSPKVTTHLVTGGQATNEMGHQPELKFWDASQSTPTATVACFRSAIASIKSKSTGRQGRAPVNKIALLDFSPDGNQLLVRTDVGQTELLWTDKPINGHINIGAIRHRLPNPVPGPTVAFSPDSKALISATFLEAGINRTDLATGRTVLWFALQGQWGRYFAHPGWQVWSDSRYVVGRNIALDSEAPIQPVFLPARVLARGPQASLLTHEAAISTFQFWRVDDARKEWNRFQLQTVMVPKIETSTKLWEWSWFYVIPGIVLATSAIGFGVYGFVLQSVMPDGRPGDRRAMLRFFLRVALGSILVITSLAIMSRVVHVGIWQIPDDSFELFVLSWIGTGACVAMALGVAMLIRAFRGYQASLSGVAAQSHRSSRLLWAVLLTGEIFGAAHIFGPASLEPSGMELLLTTPNFIPVWIAMLAGGMLLVFVWLNLMADPSRSRSQRHALSVAGFALFVAIPEVVLSVSASGFLGGVFWASAITGALLTIVVSPRVHSWLDEDFIAALRRRNKPSDHSSRTLLERVVGLEDEAPEWAYWPFEKPIHDQLLGRKYVLKATALFGPMLGLVLWFFLQRALGTFSQLIVAGVSLLMGCALFFALISLSVVAWNRRVRRLRQCSVTANLAPQNNQTAHPPPPP